MGYYATLCWLFQAEGCGLQHCPRVQGLAPGLFRVHLCGAPASGQEQSGVGIRGRGTSCNNHRKTGNSCISAGWAQQTGRIYKKMLGILSIFVVLSVVHFRLQCLFPWEIITLVFPSPPGGWASKYPTLPELCLHRAGLIPLRSWRDGAQRSSFL